MIALLVLALLTAPDGGSPDDAFASLRARGTAAYRSEHFAEACDAFTEASRARPDDGKNWADLGLCLGKLGKKDEGIAAERNAARLGDVRTRFNAYFNLDSLGAPRTRLDDIPEPELDEDDKPVPQCVRIHADVPPGQSMFACSYIRDDSGTGSAKLERGFIGCPSRKAAEAAAQKDAPTNATCVDIGLFGEYTNFCRASEVGGAACGACGCDTAPDPAACEAAVTECSKGAHNVERKTCRVVYVDLPQRRVGAVCADIIDGKTGTFEGTELGR